MKPITTTLLLIALLTGTVKSFSQDSLLSTIPATKEEFVQTESAVIHTINWLEQTALDQDRDKRKEQNAFLIAWISGSPTVTVSLRQQMLPFMKKNEQLLSLFMGGWTRYCLQNNYSKDEVQCNLAGIRMAINVYKKGIAVKKDKEMEKLVAMEENGELETWVRKGLEKK